MNRLREALYATAVATLSIPMALGVFGRPLADWSLPYNYLDDGINCLGIVQMGIERLWATGSDRLGAPGVLDMAYYPMPETGQLLLLNFLGRLAPNAAITVNLYLFLTFFLCTGCAVVVLRRFGVDRAPAALGALVFGLLPYHFWRAETHLFVSGYYWVPLSCWCAITLHEQDARLTRWPTHQQAVVAFVAPLVNVYYSFFFGMLVALTTLIAGLRQRAWAPWTRGAVTLAALGGGLCANLLRSLLLNQDHALAFERSPRQAEVYGLKLTQMLLPALKTVSTRVAHAVDAYATTLPNTESVSSDLGLVGACAFVVLLGAIFVRPRDRTVSAACTCALGCFFYGTSGGLSSMFAFLVSPTIRSPNRIVVFIAFFSILAALLLLQKATVRFSKRPHFGSVGRLGCAVFTCVLFWDLTQRNLQTISAHNDSSYRADQAYFPALEATLPKGVRVFNAPHITFPEGGPIAMEYDAFRFYVHTHAMVGSYGAVRFSLEEAANRAAWQKLAAGDAKGFEGYLREHAFAGVLFDRRIAGEHGSELEARLRTAFTPQPDDTGNDFVYFALR